MYEELYKVYNKLYLLTGCNVVPGWTALVQLYRNVDGRRALQPAIYHFRPLFLLPGLGLRRLGLPFPLRSRFLVVRIAPLFRYGVTVVLRRSVVVPIGVPSIFFLLLPRDAVSALVHASPARQPWDKHS